MVTRALLLTSLLSLSGDFAKAPDGQRGFGEEAQSQEVLKLFRNPKGEDAAFVAGLLGLEADVRVLLALAEAGYRERGYFDLLSERGDLFALHRRFDVLALDPFQEPMAEREAWAFVRMSLDARFRVRRHAASRFEDDARDLRGALALLVASAVGRAELREGIGFVPVAERADLAAAHLRALSKDLAALHEVPRWTLPPEDTEAARELVRALVDGDQAGVELRRVMEERLGRTERGMIAGLSTTALVDRTQLRLSRRAENGRQAWLRLEEVRMLLPFTKEGADAPEDIRKLTDTKRYNRAVQVGLDGLWLDPFNAELNYLVALARDFREGRRFSLAYFDRFLVLRGIRYYQEETFRDRHLDEWEDRALFELTRGP